MRKKHWKGVRLGAPASLALQGAVYGISLVHGRTALLAGGPIGRRRDLVLLASAHTLLSGKDVDDLRGNARSLPSGVHRPNVAGGGSDRHDKLRIAHLLVADELADAFHVDVRPLAVLDGDHICARMASRVSVGLRRQQSPQPAVRMDTRHPSHGGMPRISSVASYGAHSLFQGAPSYSSGGAALTSRGAPPHLEAQEGAQQRTTRHQGPVPLRIMPRS